MALSTIDYTGISQLTGPIGSAAGVPLTLQVNGGTTAISVSTSGYVGIGTTSQSPNTNAVLTLNQASQSVAAIQFSSEPAGDTNWWGRLNTTEGGGALATFLSHGGTFALNNTTFTGVKDYNGSFPSSAFVVSNQSASTPGTSFYWLTQASSGSTTTGTITALLTLNSSGNLVFGTANAGIVFDNTTSGVLTESTLNDYETGTWSPTWSGSVSGSAQLGQGTYTKVGNLVFATVVMNNVTFVTFSGLLQLSLPFTSSNFANVEYTCPPMYFYNTQWITGSTQAGIFPVVTQNLAIANFTPMLVNNNVQTNLSSSNTTLSGALNIYARFSMTYQANF
jgi:hypothetical protein